MDGRGRCLWQNGDVFIGFYENGVRSGKGTLQYQNGDFYECEFKNDKIIS